jgi:hypothetical protein
MGEVKRSPYTTVTAGVCLVLVCALIYRKADASDVESLKTQISELGQTMRRESASAELRDIRSELFEINLAISKQEREGQPVDILLLRRREELLAQQRRLESLLQAMDEKR